MCFFSIEQCLQGAATLEESMEREHARNQELSRQLGEAHIRLGEQVRHVPQEVRAAYDDARTSLTSAQESLTIAMRGAELMQLSTREDVLEKVDTQRTKRKARGYCCSCPFRSKYSLIDALACSL